MGNYFKDNEDLQFYFERGIDWAPLVELTEHHFKSSEGPANVAEAVELYRDIADLIGQFVADDIAPHAAQLDREKVGFADGEAIHPDRLQGIFDQIQAMELHGMCLPRELGGMNSPLMLYFLTSEIMGRGDVSVMAHYGFHGGMAAAMLMFSLREGTTKVDPDKGTILETRFEKFVREIARGDAWGCMDITEPDAGSDMARLRCKGEQDEDGNWFVTGMKLFITSGHGKYHFVIARTEEAGDPDDPFAGLGGLSMFLVPTYEERDGERVRLATIDRIEEKLGHHASVTAQISFERTPAFLIGKRGEGFEYMLTLMNGARLGVGFECIGLIEAAVRLAADYAAERGSMGKTIDRHEMIADYLDEMRTDVQALRAVCVHGAFQEEMATKIGLHLGYKKDLPELEQKRLERAMKRHKAAARRVTPLLKYFGAERAVEHARRGVQIHGGVGYTKEYGAEKLLRDAMVFPIYEGTSQIQSLMAMKDNLGAILKNPREFVRRGAQARWRALSARDPLEKRVAKLQATTHAALQHLIMRTAGDKLRGLGEHKVTEWPDAFLKNWNPKRDFAFAMLHAEHLTKMLFDEAAAEILLEQAKAHPDRRELLERWLDRAEPRSRHMLDLIQTTGDRLLATLEEAEATAAAAGVTAMSVPTKFVLEQGPTLKGMGGAALGVLKQRLGLSEKVSGDVALPGPEIRRSYPPRDPALVRAYVKHVGGDPSAYKGRVPASLFPQWAFGLTGPCLEGTRYPLLGAMNGGCRLVQNAPIPIGEALEVVGRLAKIDDDGRRAILEIEVVTSTISAPEALVATMIIFVPLPKKKGENGASKDGAPKEKARVPADARELAFHKLRADAGLDFAKLTGDFNPVHWVPAYAKAFGFRNTILHGFGTMARAVEGLNRGLLAGDVDALEQLEVRFTRPLVLPAKVGVYVAGDQVYVGTAPSGPAFLTGTFKARNA